MENLLEVPREWRKSDYGEWTTTESSVFKHLEKKLHSNGFLKFAEWGS